MKFWQFYVDAFRHYFDFKGKTGRIPFWSFVIISMIITFLLGGICMPCTALYGLASIIPLIMICIRRARDTGFPPLFALIVFVPVVGICLLGFLPSRSTIHF